ncbi:MAG: T9SS type A sorting domain-containing protein [Saprospiraceae bacterium]
MKKLKIMRSTSWIKLLCVIAICITGFSTNAQIVKETKNPIGDNLYCSPYIQGFLTPSLPNPTPNSNYNLEMSFDIGGFIDIEEIQEVFFAINLKDIGAPKHYVLNYECCASIDHGPGTDEEGFDYFFRLLKPSGIAGSDCGDQDFVVKECKPGLVFQSLTGTGTPTNTTDQQIAAPDTSDDDPNDLCPGVDVDIVFYGGNGFSAPTCNIHRMKIVGGYYKTMTGQVYPIDKLYGDKVCIGNCANSALSCTPAPTFKETVLESDVKVYPNPAREELNVELINMENAEVRVFNVNGEVVHAETGANQNLLLDVSNYTQGLYIITVSNEFGTFQQKFTKI